MNRQATWDLLGRILNAAGEPFSPLDLSTMHAYNPFQVKAFGHLVWITVETGFLQFYRDNNRYHLVERVAVPKRGLGRNNVVAELRKVVGQVGKAIAREAAEVEEKRRKKTVTDRYQALRMPEGCGVRVDPGQSLSHFNFEAGSCWVNVSLHGRVRPEDVQRVTSLWASLRMPECKAGKVPTVYERLGDDHE